MPVVSLAVRSSSLTMLYLDAGTAEGASAPTPHIPVLTNSYPPSAGADNIWNVKVRWNANTKAATATISDAAPGNTAGPNMLQLIHDMATQRYAGAVLGREATAATTWNIAAAGPITDLSSLPVVLFQDVMQTPGPEGNPVPGYFCCPPGGASPGGGTTCLFGDFGNAPTWTLTPFGDSVPPAAYTNLVVGGANPISVQDMLVAIWNRCVGTDWAKTYAPTLIAWMYDYPVWWKAAAGAPNGVNPKWTVDVTNKLHNAVYVPYVIQAQEGFGTGNPPDGDPPTLKTR